MRCEGTRSLPECGQSVSVLVGAAFTIFQRALVRAGTAPMSMGALDHQVFCYADEQRCASFSCQLAVFSSSAAPSAKARLALLEQRLGAHVRLNGVVEHHVLPMLSVTFRFQEHARGALRLNGVDGGEFSITARTSPSNSTGRTTMLVRGHRARAPSRCNVFSRGAAQQDGLPCRARHWPTRPSPGFTSSWSAVAGSASGRSRQRTSRSTRRCRRHVRSQLTKEGARAARSTSGALEPRTR